MRRLFPLLIVVFLLLLGVLLWVLSGPAPNEPVRTASGDPTVSPAERRMTVRKQVFATWEAPRVSDEQPVATALDAVADGSLSIRCQLPEGATPKGPPRTYGSDGADNPVAFAAFLDGDLLARVTSEQGAASVASDLVELGTVTWSGLVEGQVGGCSFEAPEWIEVRGRVEGQLTDHMMIRACGHGGDFAQVEEDGSFVFEAVKGTTCYPFAFYEDEAVFAKGSVPTYVVDGSPLVLEAPSEEQDVEMQRRYLAMGVDMFRRTEEARPDPFADALVDPELEPEVRAVLAEWARAEDDWTELRLAHLDDLSAPDADPALYRGLWLGLY